MEEKKFHVAYYVLMFYSFNHHHHLCPLIYSPDPELVNDMNGYTSERPIKMRMTGHIQPLPSSSEMVQIDSVYSVALFNANPDLESLRWAFEVM